MTSWRITTIKNRKNLRKSTIRKTRRTITKRRSAESAKSTITRTKSTKTMLRA
jgi:hypothetical protein